jgi:hypothetical protein
MRTLTHRSFHEVTLEKARMQANVASYFKDIRDGDASLVCDTYLEKDHCVIDYSYQTGTSKASPNKIHIIEEVLDGEFHLQNFRFQTTDKFLKIRFEVKVRVGNRWKIEPTSDYLMFIGGLVSHIFLRNPTSRYLDRAKEVTHHFKIIGSYPQILDVSVRVDSSGGYFLYAEAIKHNREQTPSNSSSPMLHDSSSVLLKEIKDHLESTDQTESWKELLDSLMFIDRMFHEHNSFGPRLIPRTEHGRDSALHSVRVKNDVKRLLYCKQTFFTEECTIFNEQI